MIILIFSEGPRFFRKKFFVFTRDEIDVLPQNQTEKKIIKNNNNQTNRFMNEDEDQMNNLGNYSEATNKSERKKSSVSQS